MRLFRDGKNITFELPSSVFYDIKKLQKNEKSREFFCKVIDKAYGTKLVELLHKEVIDNKYVEED